MCAQLQVPRSSYYAWVARVGHVSASAARRQELRVLIGRVFSEFRGTYGCRRITAVLNSRGHLASVGLVAKLMAELGLAAVQARAYKTTTVRDKTAIAVPDLVEGDFDPGSYRPGQVLVGDITYLRTGDGWLYLATVIDLATRMVIGWAMAEHMRTSLVIDALQMGIDHGYIGPRAIMHTDHGTQYTSDEFYRYCKKNKVIQSMGRTGVCWDNAVAESFFASLKTEMYYQQVFTTRARARFAVMDYIEVFYNRKRHHSALGYQTPAQAWANQGQTGLDEAA